MSSVSQYFKGLFGAIGSLFQGMTVTWKELLAPKVTQQYPENRKTLVISERFRGELIMPHDENNEHACTSCGICEMNCPNGTIKITSKMIETEEGRKKKILDQYHYDLSMCTFCNLCVITCPSDAIKFDNVFENAIFSRAKMNVRLNHIGSKLREKKKPQPAPTAPKPVANAEKAAEVKPTEKPLEAAPANPRQPASLETPSTLSSSEAKKNEGSVDKPTNLGNTSDLSENNENK